MKVSIYWVLAALSLALFFAAPRAEALAGSLSRVRTYQIDCGTVTAKQLSPVGGYQPVGAFKFKNGANALFLGGSDVNATTKGYPYAASEVDAIDASPGAVWCLTTGGTSTVTIFAGTQG